MATTKNSLIALVTCCTAILIMLAGCNKTPIGFISNNLYYTVNPFIVNQGKTIVSEGLIADGSTTPINVKLLAVRDAATGKDASNILLKKDTVTIFTGQVLYTDSTLEAIGAKLKDSLLAPFSVNPVGGRLQFTQATNYVPIGQYVIDIQASNIRGTKTLNNACVINVVGASPDSILYTGYTQATSQYVVVNHPPIANLHASIKYDAAGANKIIFVFKDKNGEYFDPAKGEVVNRPGRPYWHDWDPYYPQVKTDTSLEYQYPSNLPKFPIFASSSYGQGFGTSITYYAVLGKYNSTGLNLDGVITPAFNITKGTYVVTLLFSDAEHL